MGSLAETSEMIVTKISLLILGLVFIDSTFARSYPKVNDLYFPTLRSLQTTFKGFGNADGPSVNFKSPGESKSTVDEEELMKSLLEIFPDRRFFVKRAAPDNRFDDFSATRGQNCVSKSRLKLC